MNWLKNIGKYLVGAQTAVQAFTPLASLVIPGAAPYLGSIALIGNIVVGIETSFEAAFGGNATGPDKLKAAIPAVRQVILASELLSGKTVADQAKFEAAVAGITSNFADLLNSLKAQVPPPVAHTVAAASAAPAHLAA